MYKRNETKNIKVGNINIGGNNEVSIQSMTNTKTKNVKDTVKQILELEQAGCQIIRVACLDLEDAEAIREIKKQIHIPILEATVIITAQEIFLVIIFKDNKKAQRLIPLGVFLVIVLIICRHIVNLTFSCHNITF